MVPPEHASIVRTQEAVTTQVTFKSQTGIVDGRLRRVISRHALDLVKQLRAAGIRVRIESDEHTPPLYVVRKGIDDLIRDPLVMFVVGIPLSVITSLLSSWLYDRLKKQNISNSEEPQIVIALETENGSSFYNYCGNAISDTNARQVLELMRDVLREKGKSVPLSPYPDMPTPVFLEHTHKIVGWTELQRTEFGLIGDPSIITDRDTLGRIEAGELAGLSISGIVKKSTCSICNQDYAACNHISGRRYGRSLCVNHIDEIQFLEVSVVRDPVNPQCRFQIE